jgi:excisionase family DNA binding protein
MSPRRGALCADVIDPADDERLTTKAACEFLGISRSTLVRLTNAGTLRVLRVAGRNQFPVSGLRAYLASCEQPAGNR